MIVAICKYLYILKRNFRLFTQRVACRRHWSEWLIRLKTSRQPFYEIDVLLRAIARTILAS